MLLPTPHRPWSYLLTDFLRDLPESEGKAVSVNIGGQCQISMSHQADCFTCTFLRTTFSTSFYGLQNTWRYFNLPWPPVYIQSVEQLHGEAWHYAKPYIGLPPSNKWPDRTSHQRDREILESILWQKAELGLISLDYASCRWVVQQEWAGVEGCTLSYCHYYCTE